MRLTNEQGIEIILMAGSGSSRMVYHQRHYKHKFNCANACSSTVENTYLKQWYSYRAHYINENLFNRMFIFPMYRNL